MHINIIQNVYKYISNNCFNERLILYHELLIKWFMIKNTAYEDTSAGEILFPQADGPKNDRKKQSQKQVQDQATVKLWNQGHG